MYTCQIIAIGVEFTKLEKYKAMSDINIILAPSILKKDNETNESNREFVVLSDSVRRQAKKSNFLSINFLINTLTTEMDILKESLVSEILYRVKSLQGSSRSNFVILIPLSSDQFEHFENTCNLEEFEKKIADQISFLTRIENPYISLRLFDSEVEFCKTIATENHFCFEIDFNENVTYPFPLENISDAREKSNTEIIATLLRSY